MMHSWRVPSGEVGSGFGEVRGGATSKGVFSVFHSILLLPAHVLQNISGQLPVLLVVSTCCWTGTGWCENST